MATKSPKNTKTTGNPGAYLKRERRKQKVKIQTVFRQLHITQQQLKDIEEWNEPKLPKGVYLEGILVRYARLLELSTDEFKRTYSEYFKPQEVQKTRQKQAKRNVIFTRLVLYGAIFLVAATAIGYVILQTSSFASKPKLDIIQPQEGETISESTAVVSGKTSEGSQVYVNGSQVLVSTDGEFATDVVLTPGLNVIEIRAINTFSRETVINKKVNNIPSDPSVD